MMWARPITSVLTASGRRKRRLQRLLASIEEGGNAPEAFAEALDLAGGLASTAGAADTWRLIIRTAVASADFGRAAQWAGAFRASGIEREPHDERLIDDAVMADALLSRAAAPRTFARAGTPRRCMNLLAFSRPYESNGYAMRSHGLLRALGSLQWDRRIYTRPGFPADSVARWRGVELPEKAEVDDLVYHRMPGPSRLQSSQMSYLALAVDSCKSLFLRESPCVVHSASNHMTALPALIAAHELGIPFVYEVRGFWDVTRASSDPRFAGSARHRLLLRLENAVCQGADRLLTLNEPMREELVRRGCARERIRLAPNGVDADLIRIAPFDPELAARIGLRPGVPVIGYVGSFVDYEGLDDLVRAAAALRDAGVDFELLLVGDGLEWDRVKAHAAAQGLASRLHAVGRIPPAQVSAHYALIDVCVYARKAWPVCEMVSPLKPAEAMAHGRVVLCSDVAALAEIVDHGRTGFVFPKADWQALAEALRGVLAEEPLRRRVGDAARNWALKERTWAAAAHACDESLTEACHDTLQ